MPLRNQCSLGWMLFGLLFLGGVSGAFLGGCAGVKTNKAAVGRVSSVALIGFTSSVRLEGEKSEGNSPSVQRTGNNPSGGIKVEFGNHGSSKLIPAKHLAKQVNHSFGSELKWKVIPLDQLKNNKVYRQFFQELDTVGSRWRGSTTIGQSHDYMEGILSVGDCSKLDLEKRKAIASALGVDALAVMNVSVTLHPRQNITWKNKVNLSTYEPRVQLNFELHSKDQENPIWTDGNAKGSGGKYGQINGFNDQRKIRSGSITGVQEAMKDLVKRYQEFKENT